MKKKRILIGLPVLLIFLTTILALRPISNVTLEETEMIKGTLESIVTNEKTGDISLKLENEERNYYINRGLEKGIDFEKLMADVKNRKVEIYYAKHWTPLDPMGENKHISRIILDSEILYDEINE